MGEAIRQNLLGTLSKKCKAIVIGTCDGCDLIHYVIGNDPVGEAIRQNLLGTLSEKRMAMVIGTCDVWGLIDCVIGNDPVGEAIRQNLLGTLSKKRKAMVIGTCEPCGVDFNSEDQKTAHLTGKKHMKKIKLSIGECLDKGVRDFPTVLK